MPTAARKHGRAEQTRGPAVPRGRALGEVRESTRGASHGEALPGGARMARVDDVVAPFAPFAPFAARARE